MAFVMLAQHWLRTSCDDRMGRRKPFQWPKECREALNAKLEWYDNDMKGENVLMAGIKNMMAMWRRGVTRGNIQCENPGPKKIKN